MKPPPPPPLPSPSSLTLYNLYLYPKTPSWSRLHVNSTHGGEAERLCSALLDSNPVTVPDGRLIHIRKRPRDPECTPPSQSAMPCPYLRSLLDIKQGERQGRTLRQTHAHSIYTHNEKGNIN